MNKRRSSLLVLALALLVIVTGSHLVAQTEASSVDPAVRAQVQSRLQSIATELNLSDAQQQQIKPILQNEFQQLKAVKDDTSLSADQKEAKAKEIHSGVKSQMQGILTPDQQKKWESMKQEAQENWK
jgi:Spy/CpxP family protein refolding chaperone